MFIAEKRTNSEKFHFQARQLVCKTVISFLQTALLITTQPCRILFNSCTSNSSDCSSKLIVTGESCDDITTLRLSLLLVSVCFLLVFEFLIFVIIINIQVNICEILHRHNIYYYLLNLCYMCDTCASRNDYEQF